MRATLGTDPARALRRAAVLATRAPSLHNTQPWRLVLRESVLELHADRRRALPRLDPAGRQLHVSCGSALLNARVALAADGVPVVVERLPDPARPDLIAMLSVDGSASVGEADRALAGLLGAVHDRRTARRGFVAGPGRPLALPVTDGVVATSLAVSDARLARSLIEVAARDLRADPSARAELRSTAALEHRLASSDQTFVLVLSTPDDSEDSWVRTGEAYERIALFLTSYRLSAVPHVQVIENGTTRRRLADVGAKVGIPQLMVQIGRAAPTPMTRRRRLVDVLVQGF